MYFDNRNTKLYFLDTYRKFVKTHPNSVPILNCEIGKLYYFDYQNDMLNALFNDSSGRKFSNCQEFIAHLSCQSIETIERIYSKFDNIFFPNLNSFLNESKTPVDLSNQLEEGIKSLAKKSVIDLGQKKQCKVVCNQNKQLSFKAKDSLGVNGYKGSIMPNEQDNIYLTYHVRVLEKL